MESEHRGEHKAGAGVAGLLIGPAFLALAVLIILVLPDAEVPTEVTPGVRAVSITTEPMRTPLGDPPIAVVNGLERRCNDCHSILDSRENSQADLRQHTDIVLHHGLNNNCYNCHDVEDRERLVLHDGATVGYAQSEQLCAQCHGRMYRDWSRGAHGKTLGSWDRQSAEYTRLTCVQCHDPHAPMFDQIEPLPGPHTLRMGAAGSGHHDAVKAARNPLMQWSERGGGGHGGHDDGGHE